MRGVPVEPSYPDDGYPDAEQLGQLVPVDASADACAAWAATAPLTEGVLTPFGMPDLEALSQDGLIDMAVALERLAGWVQAQQARVFAALVDHPDPIPVAAPIPGGPPDPPHRLHELAVMSAAQEVACALRWSADGATGRLLDAAALVTEFPATLTGVETGQFSYRHAHALVTVTSDLRSRRTRITVSDPEQAAAITETLTNIEADVLPRAGTRTVSEHRRALRRALTKHDPRGVEQAHADAAAQRRVWLRHDDQPGMALFGATLPADDAMLVHAAIRDRAAGLKRLHDGRTADQREADALVDICAGYLHRGASNTAGEASTASTGADAGVGQWSDETATPSREQGRRPGVQVTIPLSLLLGVTDALADLDAITATGATPDAAELTGHGPIPATLARKIAADPTGRLRRLVTDDLGHLIDYGRSTYRPPPALRDHILARDHECTEPGCSRAAHRCETDHLHDWATGGHTNESNLDTKCRRGQTKKHRAGWRTNRIPDDPDNPDDTNVGHTTRWTTPTGRTYDVPQHRYPIDHVQPPEPAEPQPTDEDQPPF